MDGNKTAFTLVEILIVVVILSIMASVVVVQCSEAAEDSKQSALMSSTQALRAQLELYRMHHDAYPTDIVAQLTKKTDADGTLNPTGHYGPYLHMFPPNPFIDDDAKAVKTSGGVGEGWFYNPVTGVIIPHAIGKEALWSPIDLKELAGSVDLETFKLQAQ
jgi:general secretion pathway protein G